MRVWDVPPIPIPVPDWFPVFAEAAAGVRLGPRGNLEIVSSSEHEAIAKQVRRKDARQFYERLARWFVSNPAQRTSVPPMCERNESLPKRLAAGGARYAIAEIR